jgi:hypothetical protein
MLSFQFFNFKNFQITVFALHSSTQTTQSIKIMIASAHMNKLFNKTYLCPVSARGGKGCGPKTEFFKIMIHENFSLKNYLILKGISSTLLHCENMASSL